MDYLKKIKKKEKRKMANEENKGYKEFMEFVESATKEQISDGVYRVIPQMCTEDTWKDIKEALDELENELYEPVEPRM